MSDSNKKIFVGLDVHKDSITVAVAEAGRGRGGSSQRCLRMEGLEKGPRQARSQVRGSCCYEAGPTGYGLARTLSPRVGTATSSRLR